MRDQGAVPQLSEDTYVPWLAVFQYAPPAPKAVPAVEYEYVLELRFGPVEVRA